MRVSFSKIKKIKDIEGEVDSSKISPTTLVRPPRVMRQRTKTNQKESSGSRHSSPDIMKKVSISKNKITNLDSRMKDMEENNEKRFKIINQ